MYIDSHAHLFFDHYQNILNKIYEDCQDKKISKVINIATDISTGEKCLELADKYDRFYATSGVHPNDLKSKISKATLCEIRRQSQHQKMIGIGEIGLDYYREEVPRDVQKYNFIKQVELALEENFPIVIHCREAEQDLLSILTEINPSYRGVIHCFSGNIETAQKAIDMGFYLSFTGIITFKNSDRKPIIEAVPLEKILLETDSPFLTPIPFRGKLNDPTKVLYVAQKIAEIKNVSIEKVANITTANCHNLFNF